VTLFGRERPNELREEDKGKKGGGREGEQNSAEDVLRSEAGTGFLRRARKKKQGGEGWKDEPKRPN